MGKSTGFELPVSTGGKGDIVLKIDPAGINSPEGYELTVSDRKAEITGHDAAGVFYGIQTLLQCLPPQIFSNELQRGVEWELPAMSVSDAPDFPFRGMMLDAARYYYEPEYVKRFIDIMARYKLNKLVFHLIDDCGWRLESKKYPRLTQAGAYAGKGADRMGGYYSQDDIRDILTYAEERGVEVIPEIEFPAHFLAAIVAYPWLGCTGEQHQVPTQHFISRDLICPGKETSLTFLRDILDETMDLFPSHYLNIGGDEAVYTRWAECPDCRALMEKEGFDKPSQLQGWLTNKVAGWAAERGKRVIGWEEIIMRGKVDTPVTALIWHNPADSVMVAEGNHKAVLVPASHLYFDFPETGLPGEPQHATWMPPVSIEKAYTMPLNDYSQDGLVSGVMACLWSDQFIHGQKLQDIEEINENRSYRYVEHFALPRMLALAELGWTHAKDRDYADFEQRLAGQFPKLESAGINYRVPQPKVGEQQQNADGSVTFVLEPNVEGARIVYTTDGTWPTRHSPEYTEPVTVKRPSDFMAVNMVTPRHYSLPFMIVRDYSEYSGLGAMTGEWDSLTVSDKPTDCLIDVTGKISGNGTYEVTFVQEEGTGKMTACDLRLYKGKELIDQPEASGTTVKVETFEAGTPFTLVFKARTEGGNDSKGLIFIKKLD